MVDYFFKKSSKEDAKNYQLWTVCVKNGKTIFYRHMKIREVIKMACSQFKGFVLASVNTSCNPSLPKSKGENRVPQIARLFLIWVRDCKNDVMAHFRCRMIPSIDTDAFGWLCQIWKNIMTLFVYFYQYILNSV